MSYKQKKAFTLVELSIVIVIIGLIIAGLTAGQSMVRNYGLRKVITDMQSLQSATNTFKIQYTKYPGDFNNAFSYWGTNCAATSNACNGNGNNQIIAFPDLKEECMAFKHLALAGLIPGTYTGTIGSGQTPGSNVPRGPFSTSGYSLAYASSNTYQEGNWNQNSYGNFIWFGASNTDIMRTPIIKPVEMHSLDLKIDDGLPHSGNILVARKDSSCTVATTAPTTYALTNTTKTCAVKYRL